jgi:hypothetical protein
MLIDINIQLMRMNKYLISIEDLIKIRSQTKEAGSNDEIFTKSESTPKTSVIEDENTDLELKDKNVNTELMQEKDNEK